MENVFIAWSRNQELAESVALRLEKSGFSPIVGGGLPNDMFIGRQVLSQMDESNYAIILAQKRIEISESVEFSDNVMFEWGYLIAKIGSQKVFVYLIDTHERELPSDLIGSWVIPISSNGRQIDDIADEVVGKFRIERTSIDKLDVMSRWKEVKDILSKSAQQHAFSEFELAQFILYSTLSAYYYDEVGDMIDMLSKIQPSTQSLRSVLQESLVILDLYDVTDNLAKPLSIDAYFEITAMLLHPYEKDIEESDLKRWAMIFRLQILNLANCLVLQTPEAEDKDHYRSEAMRYGEGALQAIADDLVEYPNNEHYAHLIKSFQLRNMSSIKLAQGDLDEAAKLFDASAKERESLYFYYKTAFPLDRTLRDKLAQEYYLAQLECLRFEKDPMKKKRVLVTVRKFLQSWERDFSRQQSLLQMVQNAFSSVESEVNV